MKTTLEKNASILSGVLPEELRNIVDPQTEIPKIAKNRRLMELLEQAVAKLATQHDAHLGDARNLSFLPADSIHLVLTSPPYWTLKEYRKHPSQMGHFENYDYFLDELDKVWKHCLRALVPGGRVVCVVGDVCLSRRKNDGEHEVVPLHSDIQIRGRKIGFKNLAPILWYKIANARYEVENGGGFLGKPYEPNAVVKNDVEYIIMQRKPGGYRKPTLEARLLSVLSDQNHKQWFQQVWQGLNGASTKDHPAPYPVELAERLIRMFSFAGDTVLDPFWGTASTSIAAARWGRNSIGVEIDPHYFDSAVSRLQTETNDLFGNATLKIHR